MKKKHFFEKYNITIFLLLSLLENLAANFAHPITPTIIKNLELGDYMFGLAFAAMSFTNFLFSPFWGKLRDYVHPRVLLLIGCLGYALGQFMFSISTTSAGILIARCTSGFFVGAITVSVLVYIIENSSSDQRGQNLTLLAIFQSLGAAFGYLVGGLLGVVSIKLTFMVQCGVLILCGLLYFPLSKGTLHNSRESAKRPDSFLSIVKDSNPLGAFLSCRVFMNKTYLILFAVVLFANLGTYAFDQCFNYYVKDQFQFTSAYNGIIKAITGIVTLISNSTICMWIIKKANIKKATSIVLLCCSVSVLSLLATSNLAGFVIICIVVFAFNSIYIPLLQDSIATQSDKHSNLVMGFYNAIKSLGMIGGALIAGGIYSFNAKSPFAFAGLSFLLASLLLVFSSRQSVAKTADAPPTQ